MYKFLKQIITFLGISGIGWIMDFLIFNIGVFYLGNEFLSNIIGSFVAVTFVFIVSTKKVFDTKTSEYSIHLKYMLYIVYQIILILLISLFLKYLSVQIKNNFEFLLNYAHIIAKILVTPITMVINFIVMKLLAERI